MNSRFWEAQANSNLDYIYDLEQTFLELGKVVSQWWKDYQANELGLRELYLISPVIEALMKLPPFTRQEFCGADLEPLYQEIQQKNKGSDNI
jgi:hypothetical protein